MKKECCRNCICARIKQIDHMDAVLCPEITFRVILVQDNESLSELPASSVRIIDIDNFKCDYYKQKPSEDLGVFANAEYTRLS